MAQITYLRGRPLFDPRGTLFDAVVGTTPTATAADLTYRNPDSGNTVVFHGTFTLDGGGNVTGGTVASFDISAGATLVASGNGYGISAVALVAAIAGIPPSNFEPFDGLLMANVTQIGSAADDSISGFSGIILGLGGNDRLSQPFTGGDDPIGFIVIKGGKGDDNVNGGDNPTGSDLYGGLGNDDLRGGQTSSTIHGGKGDDILSASNSGAATSSLYGGDGNDLLSDSNSTSTMRGGQGNDVFLMHNFHTDFILGFNVKHDHIALDLFNFVGVNAGALTDAQFLKGTVATTAEQRILYDPNTGNTFYDADGTGGTAPVLFVVLPDLLKIHADNFVGLL